MVYEKFRFQQTNKALPNDIVYVHEIVDAVIKMFLKYMFKIKKLAEPYPFENPSCIIFPLLFLYTNYDITHCSVSLHMNI